MRKTSPMQRIGAIFGLLSFVTASGFAQEARWSASWASNLVVPQRSALAPPGNPQLQIVQVNVGVAVVEQVATTCMDMSLRNPSPRRIEAELLVPVPDGAALRGFAFHGQAKEPTAKLLPHGEARRTYQSIVARIKDPAILEFMGCSLVRSSVFPVEAHGEQKIRLTYEQLLPADGHRFDYFLPRTEALDYTVPWSLSMKIQSKRRIAAVYSPSHPIETVKKGPCQVSVRIAENGKTEPGPIQISYLTSENEVASTLMAYPDPSVGGGYFLLLAGLPLGKEETRSSVPREVTLVLDRSGSMNGPKLSQVTEAAMQILSGLENGERFRLIVYNEGVDFLSSEALEVSKESVERARRYLEGIKPRGGTNIHDALVEALRPTPKEGSLPLVLFLTDGLPTMGQTSERAIRDLVVQGNPHRRRVFTFGVGTDVNVPLLDALASESRATSCYVLPEEDVEVKVSGVFKKLQGPLLTDATLSLLDERGRKTPDRCRDLIPSRMPDLFEGDQLVVLGQYLGEEDLRFELIGKLRGRRRRFRFSFDLSSATTRNAFVSRLWASRKIGLLSDGIRQAGAGDDPVRARTAAKTDPHIRELVEEITRLSVQYGVLTEYTAFLAEEGTDLSERSRVLAQANRNFQDRAVQTRSGLAALNQSANIGYQTGQEVKRSRNRYFDQNMNSVEISTVWQVNDRAFYQRGNRWVDSQLAEAAQRPDRIVEFGSPAFMDLAERLARSNRQGAIALRGEILLEVDGEAVLIR